MTYVNWWKGSSHRPSEARQPHGAWRFALTATVGVVVSTGYFVRYEMKLADTSLRFAPSASEWRTQTYSDGSVIQLRGDSRVQVAFQASERRVKLLEGEAVFTATPNANRPFVVVTRFAQASTVGATFRVALDAGVTVEVYGGNVDVSVPGRPSITLKKGQRYRVIDERPRAAVAHARAREAVLPAIVHEDRSNSSDRSDRQT